MDLCNLTANTLVFRGIPQIGWPSLALCRYISAARRCRIWPGLALYTLCQRGDETANVESGTVSTSSHENRSAWRIDSSYARPIPITMISKGIEKTTAPARCKGLPGCLRDGSFCCRPFWKCCSRKSYKDMQCTLRRLHLKCKRNRA